MQIIKTATMRAIAFTLGLIVAVSVAEAARGGGSRGHGGGFRGSGASMYVPHGSGGSFRGGTFRGGGSSFITRSGGGSFQRGGIAVRSGSSHMKYGGGSTWRGGRTTYPRHVGSYGGPAKRYAYGDWRGGRDGWRKDFRHGKHFRHERRHHRRFRHFVGYGFSFYDYGYGYYGGCDWLYRRALLTRSRYWWNRYYACINYY
jgi:hypothetical protein